MLTRPNAATVLASIAKHPPGSSTAQSMAALYLLNTAANQRQKAIPDRLAPYVPQLTGAEGHQPAPQGPVVVPPNHPILASARLAPDGHHYVPDPRRPGKHMRVGA